MLCLLLTILGLVGISLGLFFVFLVWNFDYWKKRGVKGPKPTAFYGSLPSMINQKRNVVYDIMDIYKQYRDDENFVGIYNIRTPQLMILDPKLAQDIYVKDFKNFCDNEFSTWFDESNSRVFSQNPFVLRGEKWKDRRQDITPGFTPSRIKAVYPVTQQVCEKLVKFIREKCIDVSGGTDAKDISLRYTCDVVSDCVLGINANSLSDNPTPILDRTKSMFQSTILFTVYAFFAGLWPKIRDLYKAKFIKKETEDFFCDLMFSAFDLRRRQKVDRVDFLNFMLQLQDKKNLSDEQMASFSMTFLVDGFETSASVIEHCLYQLAKYPKVQEKLLKEILANANEQGELDFEKLNDLTYLDQCIHESIRIIPPLTFALKLCTQPCELTNKNGRKIKMALNDTVMLPIYSFHHDESFFAKHNEFIPERFDPENGGIKKYRDMGVFYPFGDGPRQCLGMRFALAQIKAGLVEIVKNFNIKLNSQTRTDNQLRTTFFTASLDGGVWLNFEERK